MIEERDDATIDEKKSNQEKLNQLIQSLNDGSSFEDMTKFSDDKGSSKNNGELPWFSSGQMVPEFEDAAFNISEIGEYSKPVKTIYGWHVIKLLDKRQVPLFQDVKDEIKAKIKRDSRIIEVLLH